MGNSEVLYCLKAIFDNANTYFTIEEAKELVHKCEKSSLRAITYRAYMKQLPGTQNSMNKEESRKG
jgi:hypothetical protein